MFGEIRMSQPNPNMTYEELREQIIIQLDDYLDGGEFHEYTPLEKQRYADEVIALFQADKEAAVREARIDEIKKCQHHVFKIRTTVPRLQAAPPQMNQYYLDRITELTHPQAGEGDGK